REKGKTAQRIQRAIAGKLPGEPLPDAVRCGYEKVQVPNGSISSVWRWQQDDLWYSLIQKFCYDGRHGELDEYLLLYRAGAPNGE
ncbi:hypothetical protein ACP3W1_25800, partial [Salmonella enterica]|uniref:hypothetical protein n=1 Tax=Salmonella enterica TaxID=28901 RepID=UPI003CFAB0B2